MQCHNNRYCYYREWLLSLVLTEFTWLIHHCLKEMSYQSLLYQFGRRKSRFFQEQEDILFLSVEPQRAQQIKILILIRHSKITFSSCYCVCCPFSGPGSKVKNSTHPLSPLLMSHDNNYYSLVHNDYQSYMIFITSFMHDIIVSLSHVTYISCNALIEKQSSHQ